MENMKGIKRCYLFWYMFTATMGTISNAYYYTLIIAFGNSYPQSVYYGLRPFTLLLGGVVGLALLRFGRRKVLIGVDVAMILNALLSCCNTWPSFFVCEVLIYIFFSLNYLAVLLLCKEIPPFMYNGVPIVLLNAFEYVGYIGALILLYLCRYIYDIKIDKCPFLYRFIFVITGSIPAIVQVFLLRWVFRYEPPGYSMDQCSEEDAIISLKQVCTNHKFVMAQIGQLRSMIDSRKHSTVMWAAVLCNSKWRTTLLACIVLLLLKFAAGFYSYALPLPFLKAINRTKLLITSETTFFFAVVLSAFIIDRFSLYFILAFGAVMAVVLNCVTLGLHLTFLYTGKYLTLLCVSGVLESAIHMCFLLAPAYKLVIALMPDKGVLIAVLIQFLGFMCYAYPLSLITISDKRLLALGLESVYTFGSIMLLMLILCYVSQHAQSLRRSSVSILWRIQSELLEESTSPHSSILNEN